VEEFTALLNGTAVVRDGARGHAPGFAEEGRQLHRPKSRASRPIPHIGLAQAGKGGYFDDAGFPVGTGWDEILFSRG